MRCINKGSSWLLAKRVWRCAILSVIILSCFTTPSNAAFFEYVLPNAGSFPFRIIVGPDGNLWFTESYGDRIGKITPAGTITEYALPNAGSKPADIALGPDGNLWFAEYDGKRIGKITPAGTITEYTLPNIGSNPGGIAPGPDGNLWFTETPSSKIGKITIGGLITEYALPNILSSPVAIITGPDGNLWFSESDGHKVGRITPAGVITEYALPTDGAVITDFTVASSPNHIWFTEFNKSRLGSVTTSGEVTEYGFPSVGSPYGITFGPDGKLWFTDAANNSIRATNLPITYRVIYLWNNGTGGTCPVDSNAYELGDEVTVSGNTGNLYRDGFTFNGWNTLPDGSGQQYSPGSQFQMPANNVMLYVQWTNVLPPVSIPTLSEWGMIIASLMLAGSAIWMMKRRQL